MKKLLIFAFIAFNTIAASAYNQVRLVINDGISDQPLKEKIEHAFSVVMTEINRSHERNLGKLEFPETYMYKDARSELNQLWQNDRFRCGGARLSGGSHQLRPSGCHHQFLLHHQSRTLFQTAHDADGRPPS